MWRIIGYIVLLVGIISLAFYSAIIGLVFIVGGVYFIWTSPKKFEPKEPNKQCPACRMMIDRLAKVCPHCRKKFGFTWPAKALIGFAGIFLFLWVMGHFVGPESSTRHTNTVRTADEAPQGYLNNIHVVNFKRDYDKRRVNICAGDIELKNDNAVSTKDITLLCNYIGNSGSVMASETVTIYDFLDAGKTDHFYVDVGFCPPQYSYEKWEVVSCK